MNIVVQRRGDLPAVILENPDEFGRFEVRIVGVNENDARSILSTVADLQADHAYVDSGGLFSLPGARPESDEWRAQFKAMVDYARTKGWVDGAGRIRAHVVFD